MKFKNTTTLILSLILVITLKPTSLLSQEKSETDQIYESKILKLQPTTEQEYAYVTNGIVTSVANALDIKKGYTINGKSNFDELEGIDFERGQYAFKFALLEREADKSVAAVIVKLVSDYHNKTFWFCIPVGNKVLMDKFRSTLASSLGEDSSTQFAFALIEYFMSSKLLEANFTNQIMGENGKAILSSFGLTESEISKVQTSEK